MGAVERLDGFVHQALQPHPYLLHALDVLAVHIEVGERLPGARTRKDLVGLGLHLGQQPVVFGPAVGVRLVEIQVRAVELAGPAGVALAAHGVGGALDRGGVHLPHPVPQRDQGRGGLPGRLAQLRAQCRGPTGREVLEESGAFALPGPGAQLSDERRGRARTAVQLALQTERERGAIPLQRGRNRAQAVHDGGPVLVRRRRRRREHVTETVRRGVDVGDGPQPLLGLVDGEFGVQAFPQQSRATPFLVGVRTRYPLRGVEFDERPADEAGHGLLTCGREIGQPARAFRDTEIGTGDRVEFDVCVDVGVGDLARQCAARCV